MDRATRNAKMLIYCLEGLRDEETDLGGESERSNDQHEVCD